MLPGFRKGHVPFGELKRRFGKQMTSDVINDTVYRAVVDYITENNLPVMGHPVPVEVKEAFEDGDQEFKYDLALIPQLDIKPGSDDHYPYYEIEVTEEMIDEQDKNLRKRFGKQEPGQEMTEDGVVKGTLMQLAEDGTVNQNEGAIQVTDGIVFPLYFKDKEEAAKFNGKKPGDKVVFNPNKAAGGDAGELASMLHVDKAIASDITSDFEMTISEIIVSVPAELGEEYYKMVFGEDKVHNEEEYRAAIKEMIAGELSQNSHILFRNQFDKAMMEKYGESMTLPAETIKKLFFADAETPMKHSKLRKTASNTKSSKTTSSRPLRSRLRKTKCSRQPNSSLPASSHSTAWPESTTRSSPATPKSSSKNQKSASSLSSRCSPPNFTMQSKRLSPSTRKPSASTNSRPSPRKHNRHPLPASASPN